MNAWALRRKRIILLIVFLVLLVVVGVPLYFFLKPTPSCTDNKMDGDEAGVDCGGSCTILCASESLPLVEMGDARVLKIATSTYEVVAVVKNPNISADTAHAGYTFSIYEGASIAPIKVIKDSTYVPANAAFAVFAGPFDVGSSTPTRATFAWDPEIVWHKGASAPPALLIRGQSLTNASGTERLEATVENDSLGTVSDIELVAILSDTQGNTVAASKTLVESLAAEASAPIVFTWPFSLPASTTVRILPRVLPDPSYIR